MKKQFIQVDLSIKSHREAVIDLINDYMLDEMGQSGPMNPTMAPKIIKGLEEQSNFFGFMVEVDGEFAALANCFVNYSTWQAKQLLNIHDFIVSPKFRRLGMGEFLLNEIQSYAKAKDMCRVTLEVRVDNTNAKNLYKKVGYKPYNPDYLFWRRDC